MIDAARLPIAGVAQNAAHIAVVASQTGPSNAMVSVYRHDAADAPRDWNTDHYSVLLDLAKHPDIHKFVGIASTSYDANLGRYLNENVFWIKEDKEPDHWLRYDELPTVVRTVVTRSMST